MFATAKIVGLSAILSAGIVTAYELPEARHAGPAASKYADRILPTLAEPAPKAATNTTAALENVAHGAKDEARKGDLLHTRMADRCAGQTWPNISSECVVSANGTSVRKPVRTITIEERQGLNTSVLVRLPVTEIAGRR